MAKRKPVVLPATVIQWDQPCKNGQPYVAADGSCLRCGADQGVRGYACAADVGSRGLERVFGMEG